MKLAPIAALALMLAPSAFAAEINVAYSDDFNTKLQDDLGTREGDYLSKEVREDLQRDAYGLNPYTLGVSFSLPLL